MKVVARSALQGGRGVPGDGAADAGGHEAVQTGQH